MIDVWIGDVQFGFNWQLQEWAAEDLQKLAIQLGVPESSIFPVQFTTPVIGPDGITPFAGVFTPFVNIEQHWKQITQNIRGVLE